MNMDRLWAPWRIKYVRNKKLAKCIFCESISLPKKHYVVFKTKYSISLLNIFPYNNGHLMVAPLRHTKEIAHLKEAEILDLFKTLTKTKKLLDKTLKPDGYNIGINLGRNAGAGITGHLHIHIVPRWQGDANFMPVLNNTKVVSQSLAELHKQLKKHA